ncbi:ATP-binding protein [Alicyclobacillus fastidiosus]|uniref:ATP-binding protein n=1 Tax=Alicyclobacillus fastidiosus TaxID=392011 RepID=UPI003D680020
MPPIHRFTVSDLRYCLSFAVYLAVAVLTASLAGQLRQRVKEASEREAITSALYTLSTQVAASGNLDSVLNEIICHASNTFGLYAAILLPDASGKLVVRAQGSLQNKDHSATVEPRISRWVYEHGQMAGFGTNTNRDASLLYVPVKTESKTYGVMCIGAAQPLGIGVANSRIRIVQALAGLAAVCIARIHFEEQAKIAHLTAESERLRTALLDSISHELRTPLATILGAVTGMTESANVLSVEDQQELLLTVREGAMRMNRLVTNLLGMVRMESGMLRLKKQWCDVADIVGVALRQVQDSLQNRHVDIHLPNNLPAVAVDDVLIEQVLVNLLSNAIKFSPDDSSIRLDCMEYDGILTIRIRDEGIGINPNEVEKIFDKFYRSNNGKNIPGTGLGLAICKGVIEAHGGEIFARPAEGVGTIVTIRLPIDDSPEFPDDGVDIEQ